MFSLARSFPKKNIRASGESNFVNFAHCSFANLFDSVTCCFSERDDNGWVVGLLLGVLVGVSLGEQARVYDLIGISL